MKAWTCFQTSFAALITVLGAYIFSGYGIFSSISNLGLYYLLNVGPFMFISLLGLVFWFQEGRVSYAYFFSMSYLALGLFVISDLIYVPYLWTLGILLLIVPGMDFFADNLEDNPDRESMLFSLFVLLLLSFSHYDLEYRLEYHNKEEVYYSYFVRESTLSTSTWIQENLETSVLESNDIKRERRLAAYSNFASSRDVDELPSGIIDYEDMKLERIPIKDFYFSASNHMWIWSDNMPQINSIRNNISVSVVNLAFHEMSGKSSTLNFVLDYYYADMPFFTYTLYSNEELAIYWTFEY